MIAHQFKIPATFYIISTLLLIAGILVFVMPGLRLATHLKSEVQPQNLQFNPATQTVSTPTVVELFTSEGCSSCPAADELVATAQSKYNGNVIVLSYHVDYWDRLGWKDPFSQSIFSDRQRQYARQFNLQSVYTPQAVVNGQLQFVGSNKQQLYNAIEDGSHAANSSTIALENLAIQNNQLTITYQYPSLKTNEEIVLELVLKQASTQVKRGENSGSFLHHINVVAGINKTLSAKGTLAFKLPLSFNKTDYQVVAFVQDKTTGVISGASVSQIM